ncbi:hypothetical protein E4U35_002756 [Claviceps purpurea]|nr:hypothetical protein E4U51_008355 [Claviceps purpurea]KAG6194018.1 hypothetical protein E4U10_003420 [Claviceps purpurea]KAG6205207.1 hypothetical protein E4U35_002756 [Claviceps purpurea]KAG6259760.1 hypothetical protein E4U24_000076 [Claviceps purpurea]KAG6278337.1 hypothetical protein E4U47_005779 [Claviceps purpurea]
MAPPARTATFMGSPSILNASCLFESARMRWSGTELSPDSDMSKRPSDQSRRPGATHRSYS